MTLPNRLLWVNTLCCLAIFIVQTQGSRVEYEYECVGERGCDYPRKLSYQINVPHVPRPPQHTPRYNYGYKIENGKPIQTKTHMTYTFDFTVEEPTKPKTEKPEKLHLYTKIDRGVKQIKKHDYEKPKYGYDSKQPTSCNCGEQQHKPPTHYRYVSDNATPCKCKPETCKCNKSKTHEFAPLNGRVVRVPITTQSTTESMATSATELKRSKRDLRQLLRKRSSAKSERSYARLMKKYHTKLTHKREVAPLFPNLERFGANVAKEPATNSWRKLLKRRIKRDIKGEYDLIEKERAELDLTLPEIIQYMPETLQPNFKRGQCQFNCQTKQNEKPADEAENAAPEKEQTTEPEPAQRYVVTKEKPLHYFYIVKPNAAVAAEEQPAGSVDNGNNNNRTPDAKNTFAKRNIMAYDANQQLPNQNANDQPMPDAPYNAYTNPENTDYVVTNLAPAYVDTTPVYSPNLNYPQTMLNTYTPTTQPQQQHTYPPTAIFYDGYAQIQPAQTQYYIQQMPHTVYYQQQMPQTAYYAQTTTQTPYYPQALPHMPYYHMPHESTHYPHTYYSALSAPSPVYGGKYLPHFGPLQMYINGAPMPDPTSSDGKPLYFTGDLYSPPHIDYERIAARTYPLLGATYHAYPPRMHPYPVEHLTNEELDRVIQDIIYRHPDFIEATTHYGGGLVDPEPQQKVQTISFLKKLITGRLHKWFVGTNDNDSNADYRTPAYTAIYNVPHEQAQQTQHTQHYYTN